MLSLKIKTVMEAKTQSTIFHFFCWEQPKLWRWPFEHYHCSLCTILCKFCYVEKLDRELSWDFTFCIVFLWLTDQAAFIQTAIFVTSNIQLYFLDFFLNFIVISQCQRLIRVRPIFRSQFLLTIQRVLIELAMILRRELTFFRYFFAFETGYAAENTGNIGIQGALSSLGATK